MTQHIRDRINRQLDALGEDRLYQVLDYVEFLESRYGQRAATPPNTFQRLADTIEDRLRAGGLAASTVSEAMGFLNKAVGALNGAMAAGTSVASDLASAAKRAGTAVVDELTVTPAGAPTPPGTAAAPVEPAPPPGAAAWPPPAPASPVNPSVHPPQTPPPTQTPPGTGPAPQPPGTPT
ncbi:hypothetical protein [Roseisolibacter sp. H3M3-2]|uniref:hypothetical protein n=1 Tax=Roseisolibacter sp. H3M3-2 TaxID=3031323 RepID=UPI0023DC7DB5|nr:hypothetical protein [Roseisolibacter sp. H3M3-2]MDF1503367.1 hypothetical protein [Roseisolibacter sp. H3M3-2]